jgi:cytoskeletal protein CcmA (bactofilin family)
MLWHVGNLFHFCTKLKNKTMFGSNKSSEELKKSTPIGGTQVANGLNTLVRGTTIEGTVKCENDIRIDGTIRGRLTCTAKVIIGPNGLVEGEIRCQNAVIEGQFKGQLYVADLLNVRESALVEGDIKTNKLTVQSGAKFNVACLMQGQGENKIEKPVSNNVKANQ